MAQYSIAVIVGSLRKESINRKLASALARLTPKEFEFRQLRIDDLPPYNQDEDADQPAPTKRLKAEVKAASGVIFVTPEYNRSIPGVLKNAIDHASRPYGHSAWQGKPTGVIGTSTGAIGTSLAQRDLRTILAYLDMPTMGQPEAYVQTKKETYDAEGNLAGDTREFLQKWVDSYCAFVKEHAAAQPRKAA